MSIRAKSAFRLTIVVSTAVVVVLAVSGGFAFLKYRQHKNITFYRNQGISASQQGDHAKAIEYLNKYFELGASKDSESDVAALEFFILSRTHPNGVPVRSQLEVRQLFDRMRKIVRLAPDRILERETLLEYYTLGQQWPEVIETSQALLDRVPASDTDATRQALRVKAYRGKTIGLESTTKREESLAVAYAWAKEFPEDIEAHFRVVQLTYLLGTNKENDPIKPERRKQITDYVDGLMKKDAKDVRHRLVKALALRLLGETAGATQEIVGLKDAAPPAQAGIYLEALYDEMNRIGMLEESLAVLDKFADVTRGNLRSIYLRRLWEMNRFEVFAQRTESLKPAEATSELLGMRAWALLRLSRGAEAAPVRKELARRADGEDRSAAMWLQIVAIADGKLDPRQLLEKTSRALETNPRDPYGLYYRGEANAALSEVDGAVASWISAAQASLTWAQPLTVLAEVRLSHGELETAFGTVMQAYARARTMQNLILLSRIGGAMQQTGMQVNSDELLRWTEAVQKQVPGEPDTLVVRASTLAHLKRDNEARALIQAQIDAAKCPPASVLLRLVSVSAVYKLGLEKALLERAEKEYGQAAGIVQSRAEFLRSQGDAKAGLEVLDAAVLAAKTPEDKISTMFVRARYLEAMRSPLASEAWVQLGELAPKHLAVQLEILESDMVRGNREFVSKTIDRVKDLTGPDATKWRVARARWHLNNSDSAADANAAVAILGEIVRSPVESRRRQLAPRLLLAVALERINELENAIAQMRIAADIEPNNLGVAMDLARMLQKKKDFDGSWRALERLWKTPVGDENTRTQLVILLSRMNRLAEASEVLKSAPTGEAGSESEQLRQFQLAQVYAQRNELVEAERILDKLLAGKPTELMLRFGVGLYGTMGKHDLARQSMERLKAMNPSPGVHEMTLAEYEERFGKPEAAIQAYRAATVAAPTNELMWHGLLRMQARMGLVAELPATVDAGLAKCPSSDLLKGVKARLPLIQTAGDFKEFRRLIEEIVIDPLDSDGPAELLSVAVTGNQKKEKAIVVADRMKTVAQRFPRSLVVQILVANYLLDVGQTLDGAEIAARAAASAPFSWEASKVAAMGAVQLGQWGSALTHARNWRERNPQDAPQVDIFAADMELRSGESAAALRRLAPYMDAVIKEPKKYSMHIRIHVVALVRTGKAAEAAAVLEPLAKADAAWRQQWLEIAYTELSEQDGPQWIDKAILMIDPRNIDERVNIAVSWNQMGLRFKNRAWLDRSREELDSIVGRPDTTAAALSARAVQYEQDQQMDKAEELYRRAISIRSDYYIALNNLAMVLVRKKGGLDEALTLARRAVEVTPGDAAIIDTLAHVHAARKEWEPAVNALREAIFLDPISLEWRVHLLEVYIMAGRRQDGLKANNEMEQILQRVAAPQPAVKQRIEVARRKLEEMRSTAGAN